MRTLAQHAAIEVVLDATDIGGTNATSKYLDMENFAAVDFIVTLGTTLEGTADGWNAADTLDTFKLLQATDAAASGSKDITGATVTCATLGTAGDTYVITCWAESMDKANSFTHIAAYIAEAGNTGPDFATIVGIRYHPRYAHDDLTSAYHGVCG